MYVYFYGTWPISRKMLGRIESWTTFLLWLKDWRCFYFLWAISYLYLLQQTLWLETHCIDELSYTLRHFHDALKHKNRIYSFYVPWQTWGKKIDVKLVNIMGTRDINLMTTDFAVYVVSHITIVDNIRYVWFSHKNQWCLMLRMKVYKLYILKDGRFDNFK